MNEYMVVMYHYVRDLQYSRFPNIKGLDYSLFKEQIKWLKENRTIITMEELIEAYDEKTELPENATLLTFDDGYIDHFMNVFPILKAEGIQGTFFIPGKTFNDNILLDVNKIHFILASTSIESLIAQLFERLDYYRGEEYSYEANEILYKKYAVANRFDAADTVFVKRILQTVLPEKLRNMISSDLFRGNVGESEEKFAKELYMNFDQIKCMKNAGMHIGLHGYDHYWLGNLNAEMMKKDLEKSKEVLSDIIDPNSWAIAYPYGSVNKAVEECVREMGGIVGFSTNVRRAIVSQNTRFLIPRMDTNDFPPKSTNYAVV